MYKGHVYVMDLGFENLYKIGVAGDLDQRLHILKAGNPNIEVEFSLVVYRPHPVEHHLHESFNHKRLEREVFELDEKDLVAIKAYLNAVENEEVQRREKAKDEISKFHPNGMMSLSEERQEKAVKKCHRCSSGYMVIKKNRQNGSKFLSCDNYPMCRTTETLMCGSI